MSNNRRKIEKCLAGGENHVTVHTGVNSNKLIAVCVQRDVLVNDKNHEEAANGSFF